MTFGEDDKQGGGGTSKRRGSTRPGAHPFLGGMAQLDPFGDVWQVAKPIDTGLPPAEIDGEQLQGLDTNALVWTEGLSDWLPIGMCRHYLSSRPCRRRCRGSKEGLTRRRRQEGRHRPGRTVSRRRRIER